MSKLKIPDAPNSIKKGFPLKMVLDKGAVHQLGENLKTELSRHLAGRGVMRRNLTMVGNIMCARSPKTFSASPMCCRPAEILVVLYSILNQADVLAHF